MIKTEILKKLLPYLNLLIIGLGITKLIFLYNHFGIHIVQYLEFSESLILFFEDILFYILFLLIPVIILVIFIGHPIGILNADAAEKIVSEQNFFKRAWVFIKTYWPYLLFLLWGILHKKPNIQLIVIISILFILYQTKFVLRKYYNSDLEPTYHNVLVIIVILVGIGYGELQNQIKEIESGKYKGTIINIKDQEPIISDSLLIYIGKTKDFYYLYDKKKGSALIIPSSEVSRIDLKEK